MPLMQRLHDENRSLRQQVEQLGNERAQLLGKQEQARSRVEAMQEEEKQRELAAVQALGDESVQHGVALLKTPHGFAFVPLKEDHEATLTQDEFEKLPPETNAERAA